MTDSRLIDASLSEMEVSLLFLQWEEDAWFYRWERMLGLVWTQEDLEFLAKEPEKAEGSAIDAGPEASAPILPKKIRYPLSFLVRPEIIKSLREQAGAAEGGLFGMNHVPADAQSLFGSSKEDFLRRMGATPAVANSAGESADPFGQSRRPVGGFSEGPLRNLGGRRK